MNRTSFYHDLNYLEIISRRFKRVIRESECTVSQIFGQRLDTHSDFAYLSANIMPQKHAAIKDLRKNARRAVRNARMKTHVKSLTKQLKEAVKEGKSEAKEISVKLQSATAKASKNFVLHKNKARRVISAAMKSVSKK